MKFTIRTKILGAFGVSLGVTLFFVFTVVGNSGDDRRQLERLNDLDRARTIAQDLELQTSTVWQFVTDASLTRRAEALQTEAQGAFEAARQDLKDLTGLEVIPNEARLLSPLEADLLNFWTAGQAMYAAYGRTKAEGDTAMRAFDAAGTTLLAGFKELRTPLTAARAGLMKQYDDNLAADLWFFLGLGILSAAATIALGLLLARVIARPIAGASRALRILAESQGDLTVRLAATGRDETADLAASVNRFLDKLQSILVAVEDLVHKNQNLSASLNESSRDSAASVSDLGLRVGSLRKGLGSLDLDIAGASAAIEEILANIASLARQIDSQNQQVTRSGAAIEEMLASISSVAQSAQNKAAAVTSLVHLTRQGGERVEKTSRVITRVSENADAMLGLIDLINDIADRTNLLAMNASIEAAHAGAAGRGFAVVADEIRKLAVGSGANAQKIAASLKETGDQIRQAQADAEASRQAFGRLEAEVGEFAGSMHEVVTSMTALEEGGSEILEATASLIQTSQVIGSASQEMDYGAKEILTAVHHVRDVSSQALGEVAEVDRLTQTLNRTALRVSAFGNQNRYNNTVLFNEVGRFRLGTDPTSRSEAVELGIDWNDLLSVGIEQMDDEHKELFRRINNLLVALLGPEGAARTPELVASIREYAVFHFSDEEALMKRRGYPRYEQHRKLHEQFTAEFLAIEGSLVDEGLTAGNLIRLQEKVVNWLLDHIAKVDRDYGEFLAGAVD